MDNSSTVDGLGMRIILTVAKKRRKNYEPLLGDAVGYVYDDDTPETACILPWLLIALDVDSGEATLLYKNEVVTVPVSSLYAIKPVLEETARLYKLAACGGARTRI